VPAKKADGESNGVNLPGNVRVPVSLSFRAPGRPRKQTGEGKAVKLPGNGRRPLFFSGGAPSGPKDARGFSSGGVQDAGLCVCIVEACQ